MQGRLRVLEDERDHVDRDPQQQQQLRPEARLPLAQALLAEPSRCGHPRSLGRYEHRPVTPRGGVRPVEFLAAPQQARLVNSGELMPLERTIGIGGGRMHVFTGGCDSRTRYDPARRFGIEYVLFTRRARLRDALLASQCIGSTTRSS